MLKKTVPYLVAVITFVIASLMYFSPVLRGDKLFQSDIQQFRGMSKEINDFRVKHDTEPYWTDAAFGGMPSYQLSTYYPNDYVKSLDSVIRFLPRPADYLFLYFVGFFVLLLVLKFDWKLAIIGSLAFGFSTYFIIILGVGHNAKAHAIGYIPLVFAGFILVFRKNYLWGFALTTVALALELNASHPQMTYYMLFSLLILGLVVLIERIKAKKSLLSFYKQVGVLAIAGVLALGTNAASLMATKEYADFSTRGKSALTVFPDGKQKEASTGLSTSYITEYSYGLLETFNLFIPRLTGGANSENLGTESNTYAFLSNKIDKGQARQFSENIPTYWGSQPIVAAPAYIGAIFIFLFVLGIVLVDTKLKKWLVATTIFSIAMSWGHNFSILTDFFIAYVPLYNKFRAVSSIQVLAEIAVPLLGLLAFKEIVFGKKDTEIKLTALKKSFFITGGLALFFALLGPFILDFVGARDGSYDEMIPGFSGALMADRKAIFFKDSLRTLVLIILIAGGIFLYLKGKLKQQALLVLLGATLLFDMVGTARRYVNNEDFLPAKRVEKPFVMSAIDKEILKDKGHYRVANFAGNFMNDGATSYYHKSIGGYHAAKLGRYQELVDFHLLKNNMEVLNMLNTKYFIIPDEKGKKGLQVNPYPNGNAWFVKHVKYVNSANEEILALSDFNSKETAVINKNEFAVLKKVQSDSLAQIKLTKYQANAISYASESTKNELAVFSEIYYKNGWNAYIDGKLTSHIRANYVLRALEIPAGKHSIEFKFEPTIISKGRTIVLGSFGVFFVLLAAGFVSRRKLNN
ncbi:YfhO family protein [Flavicella sediminum]|uniref:YfhO family protein n=1 Tax=Flavicella sediminum TaxID=2585141 RepID=UPI00111EBFFD|nr:YfhO family protein [Flavicella sediminum]